MGFIHDILTVIAAVKTDTADVRTDVTAIHDTDLPAVKTVVDGITSSDATLAKQNAIIADTEDIQGNVDNLHDTDVPAVKTDTGNIVTDTNELQLELAQRNTGVIAWDSNANTGNYEDIVSISDKGVLTGISSGNNIAATMDILVTIDGGALTVINHDIIGDLVTSFSFNHRFDTSLRVQHKADAGIMESDVMYTTD